MIHGIFYFSSFCCQVPHIHQSKMILTNSGKYFKPFCVIVRLIHIQLKFDASNENDGDG